MSGPGDESQPAASAGALYWQNMYAERCGDEEADPLPLMAEQDVRTGPCIAPYLATESSVVVQVAATCATVFCSYAGFT